MPKKIQLKTSKTSESPIAYINSIEDDQLKSDCKILLEVFKETTGMPAKMWGSSIVGFGEYTYYRSNGAEGQYMACGFSARKSGPTIHIMPGYWDYQTLLEKLGKHKLGKSCLYLKSLSDVDLDILKQLITRGLDDLKKTHNTNY